MFSLVVSRAVVIASVLGVIAAFSIENVAVVIFPSWLKLSGKLGVAVVVLSAGFTL